MNELETQMRDLEIITPTGGKKREVSEDKDKQLKAALTYLRSIVDEKGKRANK